MVEHVAAESPPADLLEHPAVMAWCAICPERPRCVGVPRAERAKSAVFRLEGVGPDGVAVIAKRGRRTTIAREHLLYKEILPHLPVPALRCYGLLEDRDPRSAWLFLDDAGDEPYCPLIPEHRSLAARWLGVLHTAGASPAADLGLPSLGPAYYLKAAKSGRDRIRQNLANPALSVDDILVLENVIAQCAVIESHWSEVERFCERMPRTLVHGDFVPKNLRVRAGRAGTILLAFDWECAGWGVPAMDLWDFSHDLASPEITTYWSIVRQSWPHLALRDIQQMVRFGRLIRMLVSLDWASWSLAYEWVERTMRRHIKTYERELAHLISAVGWED